MSEQRERFEAWAHSEAIPIHRAKSIDYADVATQWAWEAWQAACPDGWQCVPKEPTEEMLERYERASVAPIGPLSVHGYRMMLSAAPKPGDQ